MQTFDAVLKGARRRERRQDDRTIATGWQVENFRRMGKRMGDLAEHLRPPEPADGADPRVIAMFEGKRAQGLVTIRERPKGLAHGG